MSCFRITQLFDKGNDTAPADLLYETYRKSSLAHDLVPVPKDYFVDLFVQNLGAVVVQEPGSEKQISSIRVKNQAALVATTTKRSASDAALDSNTMVVDPFGPSSPAPQAAAVNPISFLNTCLWQGCGGAFPDAGALQQHIAEMHLSAANGPFVCQWKTCTRYSLQTPAPDRRSLIAHLRTHGLWKDDVQKPASAQQQQPSPQQQPPTTTHLSRHAPAPPIAIAFLTLLSNLVSQDPEHSAVILEEPTLAYISMLPPLTNGLLEVLAGSKVEA